MIRPLLKVKITFAILISLVGLGIYHHFRNPHHSDPPQDVAVYVKTQLAKPFHHNKIWDKTYLKNNPKIFYLLIRFENQHLCRELKKIDTRVLSYQEIIKKLQSTGYVCFKKPLAVSPYPQDKRFLRKNGSITYDSKEKDVAHQEVCVLKKEGCVVRLKKDGFPSNIRSQPHSTKAILLDPNGDPSSYNNEAF